LTSTPAENLANWVLDMRETGWRFSLRDVSTGNHYEMASVDEVLSHLKS
jgi:hypothetical protein